MRGGLGEQRGRIRQGERHEAVPEGRENKWKYAAAKDQGLEDSLGNPKDKMREAPRSQCR